MNDEAIRPNLIITGFMGTGKTAVGSRVARRLGREFVDMDRLIEARLGLTIPDIFARHGESTFRRKESELVEELASTSGKVIATGGRTLVSEANRERIGESGPIVNLRCSPEGILKRLEGEHHRPLLEGGGRLDAIERLMDARRPQYDKIRWQVDTTSLSVEGVADLIVAGYMTADGGPTERERFAVDWPYGTYDVLFGCRLAGRLGEILRESRLGGPVALVTPRPVGSLYASPVRESLESLGFSVRLVEVPDGEHHKNLDTVNHLYEQFLDAGIDRSSTVVTLGGGVISDTVGYAAATYMRGVPLVHVPTTLLAQVDAGIGGKVGVDHARGKNLIGAFFAPRLVVVDPVFLRSLPTAEVRSGSAEVVKAAMIRSAGLFERLERGGDEPTSEGVRESIRIKVEVVSCDPFEQGERAILNFGHTIGHAIEKASGYRVRHGEAVSAGMVCATRVAVEMKLCDDSVQERLENLLEKLSLPLRIEGLDVEAVERAMSVDKKKQAGKLRFVLPAEVGRVLVSDEVPEEAVHRALREVAPSNL